jgi:polyisoprenoid-binding protein YceI
MKKYLIITLIFLLIMGCQTQENILEEEINLNENLIVQELNLEGLYLLDIDNSLMNWKGSKMIGNSHEGSIKISEGFIDFDNELGYFVVDMITMKENENSNVIDHLISEDFFNVETFPTSTIELKSIDGNIVTADLTILNKTNEISFPVNFVLDENLIYANANFEIDRTKWGIIYNSNNFFKNLGDNVIKDEIEFNLGLIFIKN